MPLDNNTPEARNNPKPMEQSDDQKPASEQKETVIAAHDQATKDIEEDPDVNMKAGPEHDLDEGELARFEDGDPIEGRPSTDEDI